MLLDQPVIVDAIGCVPIVIPEIVGTYSMPQFVEQYKHLRNRGPPCVLVIGSDFVTRVKECTGVVNHHGGLAWRYGCSICSRECRNRRIEITNGQQIATK
jgi:hypothetical protein